MKCSNCKKNYKDDLAICPKCGEANSKLLEDKTMAIMEVNDDLSLTGLIFNQIEEFNKMSNEEEVKKDNKGNNKKKKNNTKKNKNVKFGTKNDIDKRKKILITMCCFMLVIILFMLLIVFYFNRENNKYDYIYELNMILSDYDNVENNTEIYDVLAYAIKDKDKINTIKENTYNVILKWVEEYKDKEYYGSDDIEKATNDLRSKIKYLSNVEYQGVTLITSKDYDEFNDDISNYYLDSKVYYDAVSYYNKKFYNESYAIFNSVEGDFLDKANLYKSKIIDRVLELLSNDIDMIESNVTDDCSVLEKFEYYSDIENIIINYDSVYSNLLLKDNSEYQEYLSKYSDLVSEYTSLVYGS